MQFIDGSIRNEISRKHRTNFELTEKSHTHARFRDARERDETDFHFEFISRFLCFSFAWRTRAGVS